MSSYRVPAAILAVIVVFFATAADADGYLIATACGEMPKTLAVEVALEDDTRENLKLKDTLAELLARHSVRVAPDAAVKLTLETMLTREGERRKGFDLGEFHRGNQSDQRTQFRINLWSSREDSLITGRRSQLESSSVDELRIGISLNDKGTGRCLWQGEAVYDLKGAQPWPIADRLLPPLIERFSRDADRDPITLD